MKCKCLQCIYIFYCFSFLLELSHYHSALCLSKYREKNREKVLDFLHGSAFEHFYQWTIIRFVADGYLLVWICKVTVQSQISSQTVHSVVLPVSPWPDANSQTFKRPFCSRLSLEYVVDQFLNLSPPCVLSLAPTHHTTPFLPLLSWLGAVRRHCRYVGVPQPARRPLPAPRGQRREWRGWARLSAAARLENRGAGANEGGDGPRDGGGPPRGQLIVLPGAGFQVWHHYMSCETTCQSTLTLLRRTYTQVRKIQEQTCWMFLRNKTPKRYGISTVVCLVWTFYKKNNKSILNTSLLSQVCTQPVSPIQFWIYCHKVPTLHEFSLSKTPQVKNTFL